MFIVFELIGLGIRLCAWLAALAIRLIAAIIMLTLRLIRAIWRGIVRFIKFLARKVREDKEATKALAEENKIALEDKDHTLKIGKESWYNNAKFVNIPDKSYLFGHEG